MYVTNRTEIQKQEVPPGVSLWWLLAERNGVPNFEMRYFEVAPEGHTSYHAHPWEHEVYIVRGEALIRHKDGERRVETGDAIYIEPEEEHQFLNASGEPLGFICIVPKGSGAASGQACGPRPEK